MVRKINKMINPDPSILKIQENPCDRCLLGKNPIPPKESIEQLVRDCDKEQTPFLCHRGTIKNEYIVCRSFYNQRKQSWLLFKLGLLLETIKFVKV